MAAAKITIVKKFTYRGDPLEEWSNTYHLDAVPATRTAWKSLAVALAGDEIPCYTSACTIVRALVYDNGDNPATYVFDAAVEGFDYNGSLSTTGVSVFAGDQASTFGIDTGLTGSTGKKIWLRKYFHSGVESTGAPDSLPTGYKTALTTFATLLLSTAIDGSIHFADKNSRRPTGSVRVDPWSTTRTLKRRGRRPTP